jgi:lactate 2-monooxygenase
MTMLQHSATDWQKEIYLKGFAGIQPQVSVDPVLLEETGKKHMSPEAYAYVAGGAGNGLTMLSNRRAFEKYNIVPRVLRDVSVRDLSIELFQKKLPSPVLLSPIGVLEMAHRDADLAVASAAAKLGVPYIFSNQGSKCMEECAAVMGASPRWFQLYWSKSNDLVASFVRRAEKCGCDAIAVTLDTTLLGWRTRDLEIAYLPFLEGKGIAQYTTDSVFQRLMDEPHQLPQVTRKVTAQSLAGLVQMVRNYPGKGFFSKLLSGRPVSAVQKFVNIYANPALTWNNLKFLREITRLPVVLKGILHPDDARKALDHGMDGIIVSNHGGRQVDGAIATLDALPDIVRVTQGKTPVLLDSGVRGGADIFKALALGASAVCIGRPYVYGLATAGQAGVTEVLRNILSDFELTMGLSGCKNIAEITRNTLTPAG